MIVTTALAALAIPAVTSVEQASPSLQAGALPTAQSLSEASGTFEVTSVRLIAVQQGLPSGASPCGVLSLRINPGRLIATSTLYGLVAAAEGHHCPPPDVLSGATDWMKSERYEVQALIPAGSPVFTTEELYDGRAPKLQKMIQNLLSDRFKLVVRREVKEVSAYNLVVVKEGKLKEAEQQISAVPPTGIARGPGLYFPGITAAAYAVVLQGQMGRTVIDKTGLKGATTFPSRSQSFPRTCPRQLKRSTILPGP
jgi:uncharacterized protein (TIGR03435 family)